MGNNRNDAGFLRAKKRVTAIKEFYVSSTLYCIIIPVLIWVNYQTTSFPWAIFPALGWGLGLVFKGMAALGINPLWGQEWENRKIQELMNKNNL
ncbi:2TM domain-containing protein [Eudoraea adriatica]|uniref:2TM domain-containing protein n=1 Tax=Eudoraea adriatica TaxID=446681 RepID=UPI00036C7DE2|nr:2TM domain-containing protein [Eudoraea adriatica]